MYIQNAIDGHFCAHTVYVQEHCVESVAQVSGELAHVWWKMAQVSLQMVQVSLQMVQVWFWVGSLRHWGA